MEEGGEGSTRFELFEERAEEVGRFDLDIETNFSAFTLDLSTRTIKFMHIKVKDSLDSTRQESVATATATDVAAPLLPLNPPDSTRTLQQIISPSSIG